MTPLVLGLLGAVLLIVASAMALAGAWLVCIVVATLVAGDEEGTDWVEWTMFVSLTLGFFVAAYFCSAEGYALGRIAS